MLLSWDMDGFKVEEKDRGNPLVNGVVRVKGRGVNHVFDELRIHLDHKLLYADSEDLSVLKGVKETIKLKLSL